MGFIFLEAREFASVYAAYKDAETPNLISKLKKVLKGPWTLSEESPKNSDARNTMFELSLAAELKMRGVDVELGEPDLVINFPKGQYFVECKRPFKETSVRANVKDAESQLRANLKPGQHGVIAVSLSRVVNPGNTMLGVTVGDQNAQGTVYGNLHADLHHRCVVLMREQLSGLSFSPDIAALMFDLSTPYITEKSVGLARGCRFYPPSEPKVLRGKSGAGMSRSTAFRYLERTIGEVLKNDLSAEAHAVSVLIDLKSQLPPGVGLMVSKNPTELIGLMVRVDFKGNKLVDTHVRLWYRFLHGRHEAHSRAENAARGCCLLLRSRPRL
jgi:hypothetical protein